MNYTDFAGFDVRESGLRDKLGNTGRSAGGRLHWTSQIGCPSSVTITLGPRCANSERPPLTPIHLIPHITPCNGPPGAASASTRRVTAGSSTNGGAWCGFARASITSEPCTAPVLVGHERLDAVNVRRRIAPREGRPEEIVQRLRGEIALVDHDHQRKLVDRVAAVEALAELGDRLVRLRW